MGRTGARARPPRQAHRALAHARTRAGKRPAPCTHQLRMKRAVSIGSRQTDGATRRGRAPSTPAGCIGPWQRGRPRRWRWRGARVAAQSAARRLLREPRAMRAPPSQSRPSRRQSCRRRQNLGHRCPMRSGCHCRTRCAAHRNRRRRPRRPSSHRAPHARLPAARPLQPQRSRPWTFVVTLVPMRARASAAARPAAAEAAETAAGAPADEGK